MPNQPTLNYTKDNILTSYLPKEGKRSSIIRASFVGIIISYLYVTTWDRTNWKS